MAERARRQLRPKDAHHAVPKLPSPAGKGKVKVPYRTVTHSLLSDTCFLSLWMQEQVLLCINVLSLREGGYERVCHGCLPLMALLPLLSLPLPLLLAALLNVKPHAPTRSFPRVIQFVCWVTQN